MLGWRREEWLMIKDNALCLSYQMNCIGTKIPSFLTLRFMEDFHISFMQLEVHAKGHLDCMQVAFIVTEVVSKIRFYKTSLF